MKSLSLLELRFFLASEGPPVAKPLPPTRESEGCLRRSSGEFA